MTTQPTGFFSVVGAASNLVAVAWVDNNYPLYKTTIHVRVSHDGGRTWCPEMDINPQFFGANFTRVAVSSNSVHVVWKHYISDSVYSGDRIFYRRGVLLPTGVPADNVFPSSVSLSQNYPNPFNPKTKIGFRLQAASFTTLKVYDIFGREVATLVNEKLQAGEHEVEWDAEKVSSGIYFYRITTENSIETRKAVLIR